MSAVPADALTQLVAFVQAEEWPLDSYGVADWLWLWKIKSAAQPDSVLPIDPPSSDPPPAPPTPSPSLPPPPPIPPSPPSSPTYPLTLGDVPDPSIDPRDRPDFPSLPLDVPDVAILRETLALNRAARPLLRKRPSPNRRELNIARTAQNSAEISLGQERLSLYPVYRPVLERALDAVVLVETHRSMALWRRLEKEILAWLAHLGAFRDIRLGGLSYEGGKVQISSSLQPQNALVAEPETLTEPRGRRIIFIFSDCTSPAWYSGAYHQALKTWGERQIVCLLSPFPEALWRRTALGQGIAASFTSDHAYSPSQRYALASTDALLELELRFDTRQERENYLGDCLRLPVLNPVPYSLGAWAGVVAGNLRYRCAGFLLDVPSAQPQGEDPPQAEKTPEQAQTALQNFRQTASPGAWQLLRYLSAVSVNLAVARLIQRHLPRARPTDLAEVLFSGLLAPRSDYGFHTPPDQIVFDFIPSVRPVLKADLGAEQAEAILAKISEFIAEKLGLSFEHFQARLLTSPESFVGENAPLIEAFAQVTAEVLEQGGRRDLAESLRSGRRILQEAGAWESWDLESITVEVAEIVLAEETEIAVEAEADKPAFKPIVDDPVLLEERATIQFETVFVNERGRIIETRTCETLYFDKVSIKMLYIPSGVFCMGSPPQEKGRYEVEGPMRPVSVSAFFMGQTPITEAQWRFVARRLPQEAMKLTLHPSRNGNNHPVVNVSWQEAMEFCARLSRYTNRNYRLPSEAEWEYACRAVSREQLSDLRLQASDDIESIWREWVLGQRRDFSEREEAKIIVIWNRYFHQPFHFGPTITSELANYNGDYNYQQELKNKQIQKREIFPVSSFPPNAFGLYEMHGNVSEWCLDRWHSRYDKNAPKNAGVWDEGNEGLYQNILESSVILLQSNKLRVRRGGSWRDNPWFCRSAYRLDNSPDNRNSNLGFRVLCEGSRLS